MLDHIYVHSDTTAQLLYIDAPTAFGTVPSVRECACPFMGVRALAGGGVRTILDASGLSKWSPDTPVLYTLATEDGDIRFGFTDIRPQGNTAILLNGVPCYLRGYIRGITAHEHPNMTGGTLKEAAVKNIRQAKKYGFNLVRFHSTIPTPEFVEAADEEGMLIHAEIGFAYEMDENGHKKHLSMDNAAWRETICRYRNHPSLAIFCIGNEMHNSGHYAEVKALYQQGRELAPGKLILDNSGWGEYDRPSADVFSQHIAYFYPYKHHGDMFHKDDCWRFNGSAYDIPLDTEHQGDAVSVAAHRTIVPLKPTLAHEAVHYIEIPDYDALARKFDDFCAKVGPDYLEKNGIQKPRFMTALPELIKKKSLTEKMPDYIQASRQFKLLAIKQYLEQCRLSGWLCGFEMLQFADCLKYENKNGIVDCFDDDKYISSDWMNQFNGNAALLAQWDNDVHATGQPVHAEFYVSDFLPQPAVAGGKLFVSLKRADGASETLYAGDNVTLAGGLQKILALDFTVKGAHPEQVVVTADLEAPGLSLHNEWPLWFYPEPAITTIPAKLRLNNVPLREYLQSKNAAMRFNCVLTDTFDQEVLSDLFDGKHVLLLYSGDNPANAFRFPGTLERFKPCIWDRGSNLGGIIYDESLQKALASNRYFAQNWYGLLDGAWKVNLDHFPAMPREHIAGVDKPVRDRMKGLVTGSKDFDPDDTLRQFSHLFSMYVGMGELTVCTLRFDDMSSPVVRTMIAYLCDHLPELTDGHAMTLPDFRDFIQKETNSPAHKEDVMNHFWEIDNKLVEDTLFWEQAGLDLRQIK